MIDPKDVSDPLMKEFAISARTYRILECALEHNTTLIGINYSDDRFIGCAFVGIRENPPLSLYSPQEYRRDPAVWHIARKAFPGLHAGCGNVGQHQITTRDLLNGIWVYENDQWNWDVKAP